MGTPCDVPVPRNVTLAGTEVRWSPAGAGGFAWLKE